MAVVVYYWAGVPGHVAIKVDGGSPSGTMYLSRWPKSIKTILNLSFEGVGNSYADDMTAEGGATPHSIRLTKLNESAVKRAIMRANQFMVYNAFQANCSSHVRACLDAGVSGLGIVATSITHGGLLGFLSCDTPFGVWGVAAALEKSYG